MALRGEKIKCNLLAAILASNLDGYLAAFVTPLCAYGVNFI